MGPPVAPTLRLPQVGLQATDTACHPVRCRLGPLSQSTGDRQPRNPHSFLPVVEAGKSETGGAGTVVLRGGALLLAVCAHAVFCGVCSQEGSQLSPVSS